MAELHTIWAEAFNKTIGEEQEKSGLNPIDWRRSGRVSKEWPDKENGDWWNANGLEMFVNFANVWEQLGWSIWHTPEGVPGIELEINQYYGDIFVKAFVDLVVVTSDGELAVVDLKTGKTMPSNMQLGLYASSIEKQFGMRPSQGYYYDARKAVMMPTENLGRWTPQLFTELFRQFELGVQNKIFLPNVGMGCSSCSVSDYCYANNGSMAEIMDPLYAIAKTKGDN